RKRIASGGPDLVRHLLQPLAPPRAQRNRRMVACGAQRRRAADAGGAAGDGNHFGHAEELSTAGTGDWKLGTGSRGPGQKPEVGGQGFGAMRLRCRSPHESADEGAPGSVLAPWRRPPMEPKTTATRRLCSCCAEAHTFTRRRIRSAETMRRGARPRAGDAP